MNRQRTLGILKPDLLRRNLIGEAINTIEKDLIEKFRFNIVAMKLIEITEELAEDMYMEHKEKPFFNRLKQFITSGPSLAFCLEGRNSINLFRQFIGATDPSNAEKDTFRKKFGISIDENSIHGSASEEDAKREINIFFEKETIG